MEERVKLIISNPFGKIVVIYVKLYSELKLIESDELILF